MLSPAAITLTCDPNIDAARAGLCATMNSTSAALYNSTFSKASANIYVKFGKTGLGGSTTLTTQVSYASWVAAITAAKAIPASALTALNTLAAPLYGAGNVSVNSALAGIPVCQTCRASIVPNHRAIRPLPGALRVLSP